VIRLKILPRDVSIENRKIVESVAAVLPPKAQIRGQKVEPIAFGLSAVIIDIVAPEEDGMVDRVEQLVSTAPLVGQSELLGVSRMSSRLPPQ